MSPAAARQSFGKCRESNNVLKHIVLKHIAMPPVSCRELTLFGAESHASVFVGHILPEAEA